MSGSRGALLAVALLVGIGVGWFAAMYVSAGPPIADAEDAYVRYRNALDGTDSLLRTETLVKLTKQLTPETLPGATRAFHEDLWPLGNSDIRILMAYWAKNHPREMIAEVLTWNNLRVQQVAATEAVSEIAAAEGYPAAREFFDSMPVHVRQSGLVNLVLAHVDHGELTDLAGFISGFSDHTERDRVAEVAVERMIDNHGPEAVQLWIESLPAGKGNSSDVKPVAFRAAQRAHMDNGYREEFQAWLEKLKDQRWARGGWRAIGVTWAKTDPVAAIEWARGLPDREISEQITPEIIRVFSVRDVDSALSWILAQEPSLELDRGTGRLAVHYSTRDPDLSLDLMERIVARETFDNSRKSAELYWRRLSEKKKEPLLARAKAISQARLAVERGEAAESAGAAEIPESDEVAGRDSLGAN